MSNELFNKYKTCCDELEEIMNKYGGKSEDAKKLRGALAAELLKEEMNIHLQNINAPFHLSGVNCYIAGSKFEYDLLLVKKNATPFMGIVYYPEDVVAIIESKAGGLFDVKKDTDNIAKAVNCAKSINPDIRFGYITMSENVPVNEYNRNGNPTVRHWDLTVQCLNEKICGEVVSYAVTLHQGKSVCDTGKDKEFEQFIDFLINGN